MQPIVAMAGATDKALADSFIADSFKLKAFTCCV
jgi:hypothetical protein